MADVKQTLNGWINYASPKLGTFLHHTWKNQQQALTYKEIREAIMAGQLDLSYLEQWRQDYSKFIINGYAPLAQQAIDYSAKELKAMFGLGAKSLTYQYVDQFIADQGGKLIREVSEEQFKAINVLVRQATMSETMDVKQLAYAIRPTVGLTQRQSQAAFHRYEQAIANGYTEGQARKQQALYAERLHRMRAETISITEMAFAYNHGQQAYMQQCIQDGLIGGAQKRWITAFDERVCPECGKLDNETVNMDDLFSIGVQVPPAHPRCRCVVNYINVTQPADWVDTPQQQATQAPPPDVVEIPPDVYIEDGGDKGLFYDSPLHIGGTGEMHLLHDNKTGLEDWIFKPGQTKAGKPEPFRAYVQEAGYKVQGIVDPDSMVEVGTGYVDIPGKGKVFGAAQRRIGNLDKSFDLENWQYNGGTLDPSIVSQLQRENVTDWLLGNYDCHGRNFVLTQDGKLYGVDKEQAFRYISQSGAQSMSLTYHPNSVYGETEPVYNTLYRRFAKGEIDIRLNDTLAYIKRVEAIPDNEYREIFRDYAEALHGKGIKAEQLLDQIVFRKQQLRQTFETFYSDLLTQRKGSTQIFTFVDTPGAAATVMPTPATMTFTPATLKGMKLKDLMDIAKAKGIKSYGIMHKSELIDAISDPSKIQQSIDSAQQRYKKLQAGRKARAAARAAQATGNGMRQLDGITQLSDAIKNPDAVLQNATPRGVALIGDTTALEGMEANLRKITIDGQEYIELTGKMTQTRWERALQNLSGQSSGSQWRFNEVVGSIDYTQPVLNLSSTTKNYRLQTKYIRSGDDILIVAGSDADTSGRALMGQFNIRVKAGPDAGARIQQLIGQAGIGDVTADATGDALERYKKMRVIWQTDPQAAAGINVATATDAQIDLVLNRLGITQQRLNAVRVQKIREGYWTLIDPENLAIAKKYDAAYIYAETTNVDNVASMISSGEMLPTLHRWGRGITAEGMSSRQDIRSGGADSVFTRIVFKGQVGKERRYGLSDYMLIFDTKSLERTDWYAYTGDRYGTTETSTFNRRYGTAAHFKEASSNYNVSNEVCFPKTMPMTYLKEVRVPSAEKQILIDKLHAAGIYDINGIRLENLITTIGWSV